VEYVHFSGKFPQFANIGITNLKSNIAYLYDETYNQFNAIEQSDVIPELIAQRLQDIEQFLENVKGKLTEKEIQKIRQLIDEIEDQQQKYKNYAKNIKIMMYNNRSRMNMKHIPTQNTIIDYD
jgi:predicted CopG family antitoxin